jgi:hypothetical protein
MHICIYVYVYMYVCMKACMYMSLCICMYVCMYVCTFIFFLFQQSVEGQSVASPFIAATVDEQGMYVCMYVCRDGGVWAYWYIYVCMYVGVYADGSASSVTYLLDKVRKNKRQRGEFENSVHVCMYVCMYGVCMYCRCYGFQWQLPECFEPGMW